MVVFLGDLQAIDLDVIEFIKHERETSVADIKQNFSDSSDLDFMLEKMNEAGYIKITESGMIEYLTDTVKLEVVTRRMAD